LLQHIFGHFLHRHTNWFLILFESWLFIIQFLPHEKVKNVGYSSPNQSPQNLLCSVSF
jgi:hypothetical protein